MCFTQTDSLRLAFHTNVLARNNDSWLKSKGIKKKKHSSLTALAMVARFTDRNVLCLLIFHIASKEEKLKYKINVWSFAGKELQSCLAEHLYRC